MLDSLIVLLGIIIVPVIMGVVSYISTIIFNKSHIESFEEALKVYKIFLAVGIIGILMYIFLS